MTTKTSTMTVEVEYEETDEVDAEGISNALDILMDTAISTPDILDDYGNPSVGAFIPRQRIHADVYVRSVLCQGCESYEAAGGVSAPAECHGCWTLRPSNYSPR